MTCRLERRSKATGLIAFMDDIASKDIVSTCFTRNLVAYTAGARQGKDIDYLALSLAKGFHEGGGNIQKLIEDLLVTPDLYTRSWE